MSSERSTDPADLERLFATVVLTDIVDSTAFIIRKGHEAWHHLLRAFYDLSGETVLRFHGEEIGRTGDGTKAIFGMPTHAIECAIAIRDGVRILNVEIRVGLHVGEIRRTSDGIEGLAIHIAARILQEARAGELLASSTVRDLLLGSNIPFEDRGLHHLRGIPEEQRLYAIAS